MPTHSQIKSFIRKVRAKHDERIAKDYQRKDALATTSMAGLMSADDKIKLNSFTFDFERGTLSVVTNQGTLTFSATQKTQNVNLQT